MTATWCCTVARPGIVRLPHGEMIEVHEPISDTERWVLTQHACTARPSSARPPTTTASRGEAHTAKVRARVSRFYFEDRVEPPTPLRSASWRQRSPLTAARRCLVTGATGYIGGRLVPELLAAGYRVRVMARHPESLRDHPWTGDVEIVRADASDAASLAAALRGRRRRLLPDPRAGHGRLRAHRPGHRAARSARPRGTPASAGSSTSAGSRPTAAGRALGAPALAPGGRPDPARLAACRRRCCGPRSSSAPARRRSRCCATSPSGCRRWSRRAG